MITVAEVPVFVYVREQPAPDSVQYPLEGVKEPLELVVVKPTRPEGDEPATVAVHVVNFPTSIEEGEQETDIDADAITVIPTVVGVVVRPGGEPVTWKP